MNNWLFKKSKVVQPKSPIGIICIGFLFWITITVYERRPPIAAFVEWAFCILGIHFLVNRNNKKNPQNKATRT